MFRITLTNSITGFCLFSALKNAFTGFTRFLLAQFLLIINYSFWIIFFKVLDEAADAVLSIDVCAHQIASGSADSNVRIYNIREGKMSMGKWKMRVSNMYIR